MDISLSNGEGQGSLACCSPCCHKELDTTEWLNNNTAHIRNICNKTIKPKQVIARVQNSLIEVQSKDGTRPSLRVNTAEKEDFTVVCKLKRSLKC